MAGRTQGKGLEKLARRLCPDKTNGEVEHELVPSAGRKLTPAGARTHAIDRVAAVVRRTCTWGALGQDWDVGDYRFLVLEFCPKRSVCLYLQIWSEPGEPVLVEACSGAWNPTARPHVGPKQRAALRAFGYRVGGRARNYQKRWTLSPAANDRSLAAELVALLVDVYGYRGNRPIGLVFCAESRTAAARVFPSVERDDVRQMLKVGGCRVVEAPPGGPVKPGVLERLIQIDQPFPFTIELKGESGTKPGTYEAMRLITVLDHGRQVGDPELAVLQRECPFARIFRDPDRDLMAIYDVPVAGASMQWFLLVLAVWGHSWRTANRLVLELLGTAPYDWPGRGRQNGDNDPDDVGLEGEGDEEPDGEPQQSRPTRTVVH
jgi:hypothetical protein